MTEIYILNSLDASLNEKQRNKLTELEAALQDFGSKTTIQYFHSLSGFMNIFVCEIPNTNHKGRFILKRFNDRDYLLVDTDYKHNYNQDRLHKIETTMYSKEDMQPLNDEEQGRFALTQAGHDINTAENAARISSIPAKLLGNKIVTPTQTQFNVSQNICEFLLGSETNIFSLVEGVAGSGKTLIIQDAITSLANSTEGIRRILYLAPTKELANKMIETIKNSVNGELPDFIEVKTFEQADQDWELISDAEKNSIYIIKDEAQRDFSILSKAAGYLYLGDDNQVGQNQAEIPDFIGKTYKSFIKEMVSRYNSDSDFAEYLNAKMLDIANQHAQKSINNAEQKKAAEYLMDPLKLEEIMRNSSSQERFNSYCIAEKICKIKISKAIYQAIQTICNVTLLHTSIRCPQDINDLAESLLKLRTNEHGKILKSGILKKSADTVQDVPHEHNIYTADLTKLVASKNIHDAHIVFTEEDKTKLENKSFLNVFTAQECAGLEFANVYLHINAGAIDRIFNNKTQAQLLIAQLYTAITRATGKIIISTSFLNATEKNCDVTRCIAAVSISEKTLKASKESSKEELVANAILLTMEQKNDQAIQSIKATFGFNDFSKLNEFLSEIKIIASTEKSNIEKITALRTIEKTIKDVNLIDQFIKIYENSSEAELVEIIKLNPQQFVDNVLKFQDHDIFDKLVRIVEQLDYDTKVSFLQSKNIYENYTSLYNQIFDSLTNEEKIKLFCASFNYPHILKYNYYQNKPNIFKEIISKSPELNLNSLINQLISHGLCSLRDIHQLACSEEYFDKMPKYRDVTSNLALPNVKKDYKEQYIHDLIQSSPADEVRAIILKMLESKVFNLNAIYHLIENISNETKKNVAIQCFFEQKIEGIKLEDYKEKLEKLTVKQFVPIVNMLVNKKNFELLYYISRYASKEFVSYINQQVSQYCYNHVDRIKYNYDPILVAISDKDLYLAKLVIDHIDDLNSQNNKDVPALMLAITLGTNDIAILLIEKGINRECTNKEHDTALIVAAFQGNIEIAKLLIEKGACLDNKNQEGNTALLTSIFQGNIEVANLLIESDACLDSQNQVGSTALMLAIDAGYNELAKLLIKKKACLDSQNQEGNTALMLTICNANIEVSRMLIEKKAQLNLQDNIGFTALKFAVSLQCNTIVKLLIENGADLNIGGGKEITALIIAINARFDQLAQLLIESGAALNIVVSKGMTALMCAANTGNLFITKKLIENDADTSLTNYDGLTAVSLASKKGYTDIVELINNKHLSNASNEATGGHTSEISSQRQNDHPNILGK